MPAKKSSTAESTTHSKPAAKKVATTKKAATKHAAGRAATDKYTNPGLRDHIKQEVMAGDKGGNPGQWSARKAQLVAHEYEAEGGGYKGGRDETQNSLKHWGDEHWTTKDGAPAKQDDGMHRYLPEKAWDELTAAEKAATDKKKLKASGEGKQFAANTAAAKTARKHAGKSGQ